MMIADLGEGIAGDSDIYGWDWTSQEKFLAETTFWLDYQPMELNANDLEANEIFKVNALPK